MRSNIQKLIRTTTRWRRGTSDYETALVVLVPSVEERIVDLRPSSNANAMAAHVTILYPFVRTSLLTSDVVSQLRLILSGVRSFTFELSEVGWFGERVLFLVPNPASPFQEMTQLLTSVFPDQKPYGGEFTEIVPHLTVAEGASPSKLRDSAHVIKELLPIHADANAVSLMTQDAFGNWAIHSTFELGR